MESTAKCPSEKAHALGTNKASHVISKLANYGGSSAAQKMSPTIRIVHIFAPKVIKTDAANFRSLVQKLTGKSSSSSSAKSKASATARSVHKSEKKNANVGRICPSDDTHHYQIHNHHLHRPRHDIINSGVPPDGSELAAPGDPSNVSAKMEENPEFVWFQEYPFGSEHAPLAEVKAEVLEEAMNPWDNFSGFFGGFGELDILVNSSSGQLLPDFPSPAHLYDQAETGIFRSSDPIITAGGFL